MIEIRIKMIKKRGKEKTKQPSLAAPSASVGSGEATLRKESIVDGSGKHVVAPVIVTGAASEKNISSSAVTAGPNLTDILNVLSTIREEQSSQATNALTWVITVTE